MNNIQGCSLAHTCTPWHGHSPLKSTHKHKFKKKKNIFRLVLLPALSVLNPRTQQTTPIGTNLEELFSSTMTLFERVAHVPHWHPDFRRSPSLKGMPSRQMPSQMHQARLCRDRWDTVCYNWQQSSRANSENLTLAKHILHSNDAHPGDTKWGRGLGGGQKTEEKVQEQDARRCPQRYHAAEATSPTQTDQTHETKFTSCCWGSHKKQFYF